MKFKLSYLLMGAVMLVLAAGCSSEKEGLEIDIPDDMKEAIQEVAAKKDYVFYTLKTASPKTAEDLKARNLVVCCEKCGGNFDLSLAMSSNDYLSGSGHLQTYISSPIEKSIPDCIQYLQYNPLSILVMERDVKFEQQD